MEAQMKIRRRDLGALLPALLLPGGLNLNAIAADIPTLESGGFPYEKLEPKTSATGSTARAVFKGKLATGEFVEVHETILPPGAMPHPPHSHVHSEMWLMREGTAELTINGKTFQIGAGGVAFTASNELHGIKNPGAMPCSYYVVAIGPGAAG